MTSVDELIRNDHKDLFSCIYERVKHIKRDLNLRGNYGYIHMAASRPDSNCLQYLLETEGETPNEICNIFD